MGLLDNLFFGMRNPFRQDLVIPSSHGIWEDAGHDPSELLNRAVV